MTEKLSSRLHVVLISVVALFFVLGLGSLVFLAWVMVHLPKLNSLQDYSPALTTEVVARDGRTIGEFFEERRYLKPVEEFPGLVVSAFTSAEDDRFFEHPGIDLLGIGRAFWVNLKAGKVVQGGSTITQQVAKSLLLSSERSFERKFKEVLLAYKIERNFSKQQILYLYLNQIYLGQRAYGVEAAARSYFHKTAKDLSVGEAALLAGLVQAPSRYTPTHNPKRARERQEYVLRRMREIGSITEEQMKQALAEPIKLYEDLDTNNSVAPYYVEHVRQYVQNKYGSEQLYRGGLKIQAAADYDLSLRAAEAVRSNLQDLDKRQGYRGPIAHLGSQEEILAELKKIRAEVIAKSIPHLVFSFSGGADNLSEENWREYSLKYMQAQGQFTNERDLLLPSERYRAVVTRIDPDDHAATVLMGSIRGQLPIANMRWAKRIKAAEVSGQAVISRVSEALKPGDVIWVKMSAPLNFAKDESVIVSLDQDPLAQSALLSMELSTGHVLAMIGGYDYKNSEYNRALQGERQPGSAFKAFLYAAALDRGFTAASIIVDAPIVFENQGGNNLKWIPENNSEKYYGDTTFRTAFVNSRNVPAIKILQEVQLGYFTEYLRGLGIEGAISPDLSLALGSKGMTLEGLTRLYALFPRTGVRIEPVFVMKVSDKNKQVLEEYSAAEVQRQAAAHWLKLKESTMSTSSSPETEVAQAVDGQQLRPPVFDDPLRAMDERTAFIMNALLQDVVQSGTATPAKALKRKIGGKTGTTNEYIDAWFVGFSPEVVTGVWTGFDAPRTLGPSEVGSRAALPAWMQYMEAASAKYTKDEYEVPKGIVFVRMDPKTGTLAKTSSGGVRTPFREGTEPGAAGAASQAPDSNEFFREDL